VNRHLLFFLNGCPGKILSNTANASSNFYLDSAIGLPITSNCVLVPSYDNVLNLFRIAANGSLKAVKAGVWT